MEAGEMKMEIKVDVVSTFLFRQVYDNSNGAVCWIVKVYGMKRYVKVSFSFGTCVEYVINKFRNISSYNSSGVLAQSEVASFIVKTI